MTIVRAAAFNSRMGSGLNRPAGHLELSTALQPYTGSWDQRRAAHLLRRAGFGGTPDEVASLSHMTPHDAVESLIHFPDTSNLPAPENVYDPRPDLAGIRLMSDEQRRQTQNASRKAQVESIASMQMWWLNRMLTTPAPLQEKMTLFFQGHFTSAAVEKGVWPTYVWQQNQLFRSNALGNLRDLTLAVSKDPAMLLYLDNASSNKSHPNENYARELMELFTLGHGNYSEEDIRQSARAFTGWTLDRAAGAFTFNARIHDDGTKTFLGRSGDFDGADIVQIIYQQPACSRFWSQTLLSFFVYNDPEPELVDAFARVIQRNDFALAPSMSVLLRSNVFFSDRAYRALVKSPVEFVVGSHKAFGLPEIAMGTPRALAAMGQILFHPPNVAGWPGGANWITSETMIARQNAVEALVNSQMMARSSWMYGIPMDGTKAAQELAWAMLQGDVPAQSVAQLVAYLDGSGTSALAPLSVENAQERIRGAAYLTAAMPTYQLA
jgi:uncharacterized protein (DUF1800 family)